MDLYHITKSSQQDHLKFKYNFNTVSWEALVEKQRWMPTLFLKMSGMGGKVWPGKGVTQASGDRSGEMRADTAGVGQRGSPGLYRRTIECSTTKNFGRPWIWG